MGGAFARALLISSGLLLTGAAAQTVTSAPVKASLCAIAQHPESFNGKRVQIRGTVETGEADLPAGLADENCGAELKFFTPDEQRFTRLVKSKEFRKLIKESKRYPVVEVTATGTLKSSGNAQKPDIALALESVENVAVKR